MSEYTPLEVTTYDFCQLIHFLIQDIQHLETEVVRTRFQLSRHLPELDRINLQADILSDLACRYEDHPAYLQYIDLYHNNLDPLSSDEWTNHIISVSSGKDSTLV